LVPMMMAAPARTPICDGDGIVVADDFLPATLFARALAEFQRHMHEHESSSTLESVVQLAVPRELERGLREFATAGTSGSSFIEWKAATDADDDGELIELSGQAQRGDHPDHADVTCCGGPVDGRVCLLYLSGQGALVFTDVSTGKERRVEITPNRAVSWPNAQHTHRVEAAPGRAGETRLMIGPYFADSSAGGDGQLARCMSPKGMFPTGGDLAGLGRFLLLMAVAGAAEEIVRAPFAVVYAATSTVANTVEEIGDEIAGTAALGSQVREGSTDAGYRFGDFTRGILAKGAGKRSGDTADDYKVGDFARGVFTSADDREVTLANQVAMVNAGRRLMVQHRLAIAKLTHPRLVSNSFAAAFDYDVFQQVIAHLGLQMLHDASDDSKVETLMRTNSRLAVFGTVVSDDRYAQPGGLSIGDPIAVMDDAKHIVAAGLLDSYDNEKELYCITTGTGELVGFSPARVMPLKWAIGKLVQIAPAARTWVDPAVPEGMEAARSTLYTLEDIPDPATWTQLDTIFADAIASGLTDAGLVSHMRVNISRGRFTEEHYISMFAERLRGRGGPPPTQEAVRVAWRQMNTAALPFHASAAPESVPVGAIARVTKISDTIRTSKPSSQGWLKCKSGTLYVTVVVGLKPDVAEAGALGAHGRLGVMMDGPPDQELTRFIECMLPLHCVQPIAVDHGGADGETEAATAAEEGVPPALSTG
jgi:hypothetical protein